MGFKNNWYEDSEEQASGKNNLKREWLLSVYKYFWPLPVVGHSQLWGITDWSVSVLVGVQENM